MRECTSAAGDGASKSHRPCHRRPVCELRCRRWQRTIDRGLRRVHCAAAEANQQECQRHHDDGRAQRVGHEGEPLVILPQLVEPGTAVPATSPLPSKLNCACFSSFDCILYLRIGRCGLLLRARTAICWTLGTVAGDAWTQLPGNRRRWRFPGGVSPCRDASREQIEIREQDCAKLRLPPRVTMKAHRNAMSSFAVSPPETVGSLSRGAVTSPRSPAHHRRLQSAGRRPARGGLTRPSTSRPWRGPSALAAPWRPRPLSRQTRRGRA